MTMIQWLNPTCVTFSRTEAILSGDTEERTNMRDTRSTDEGGMEAVS